jgi:glycosyltransferase involved in cell wall biosynthesis
MTDPSAVVILNDYASTTGGSSAVAIASAVGLAERGVPVTYFSCVGPVDERLRATPGIEVVCLDQHELGKNPSAVNAFTSGLRNRAAVGALGQTLDRHSPATTVVHAHTWMQALSPAALSTVTSRGFRLVATLHDFFITCPTGGFFEHRTERICTRRPLSLDCISTNCDRRNYAHKLWRVTRTVLQNNVLHVPDRVSHFVGVSEFSLDVLRPLLPSGIPISVIRNPVDAVDEGQVGVADNRPFVYIGRFVPEKGPRLFAEAVRRTGLPAVFVGDGELAGELKAMCPEARFTGWIGPDELRAELGGARALVFPPLWYETLGLVTVEAAAAGVPAIVSDRCAATDSVVDGETGLHFSHGSVASLGEAMQRLADDDAMTARLGAAAYAWYWDAPWTTKAHVDAVLAVYRSLASPAV